MSYIVKVPIAGITVDQVAVSQRETSVTDSHIHVTVYAQIEDDSDDSVVAGPKAFSAKVGKTDINREAILKNQIVKQLKAWLADFIVAKSEKDSFTDFESMIELEVAK